MSPTVINKKTFKKIQFYLPFFLQHNSKLKLSDCHSRRTVSDRRESIFMYSNKTRAETREKASLYEATKKWRKVPIL